MRAAFSCIFGMALGTVVGMAHAQTHKVEKAETVVRAVGVYEWTGDLAKPTASRLVPVSVYIDRRLEDGGVYLARPIPFELGRGTVFELEKAGTAQGTLEVSFARHLQTADKARIDDGWFAYGPVKPKPVEAAVPAKKSGPLSQVVVTGGAHPSLSTAKADDPAKTTVDRSGAAGSGTTVSAGKADADEAKKPVDEDSDYAKDDPDRPTLKKRSVAQTRARDKKADQASISATGDLNDDPDRPNLHRGKPVTSLGDEDLPPLKGVPAEMKQMVAVSDAASRPEHEFGRAWDSPEERVAVLEKLRGVAGVLLAGYGGGPAQVSEAKPKAVGRKKAAVAPLRPFDEKTEMLNGYTLSFGGAATYVYSAQTVDAVPRYVLVVAQREPDGSLKMALTSVTDAEHLDRTPQMRLVDVVDPDASNRASLLFELRGSSTREFGLYRVIGAQAEQTLVVGGAGE